MSITDSEDSVLYYSLAETRVDSAVTAEQLWSSQQRDQWRENAESHTSLKLVTVQKWLLRILLVKTWGRSVQSHQLPGGRVSSPRGAYPLQGVCVCACVCAHVHARSVVADSLLTHWPAMLLCPRGFAGKNTRVVCQFLLQGNFLTQELNPCLLPLSPALAGKFFDHLSHWGSSTLFRDHLKLLSPDSECRHTLSNPVSQQNVLALSCLTGGKSYLVKFNFIEVI